MIGFLFSRYAQKYLPISPSWGLQFVRGLLVGATLGFLEWRVLDQYRMASRCPHWIARTAAGYTLAVGVFFGSARLLGPQTSVAGTLVESGSLALAGAVMGLIQATAFPQPGAVRAVWVGAVAAAWVVGAFLPAHVPGMETFAYYPNAVAQGVWGASLGVLTLYPLARLARASPPAGR